MIFSRVVKKLPNPIIFAALKPQFKHTVYNYRFFLNRYHEK
jgi:hypothetical protein